MNTDKFEKMFLSLSPDQIEHMNQLNDADHQLQAAAFKDGYEKNICYLCGKPFKTISQENPCLHWLLRQCKFKKKDFPLVFNKYGYSNIAAFLRWCANQEKLLSNINDLDEERKDNKIISYTIKWKNIEWTFDCSKNDFEGHKGSFIDYPHYHFQMRIDDRPFINFNEFHLPFNQQDLFILNMSQKKPEWFHHDFGSIGSGMQDAVSIDPDIALDYMSSADENDATFHLSTVIEAIGDPIPGELIDEIKREAEITNKPFTVIAKEKLKGIAIVKTVITPADSIPDIASRTEHKPR